MEAQIDSILYQYSYPALFGLTVVYFTILYFGLGSLFLRVCKFLERKDLLHKISFREIPGDQLAFEIKHSVQSILIFGLSVLPIIYLVRVDVIQLVAHC